MDGIDYKPNGEILISFDEKTWKLARPKLRTYRWLSEKLTELREETTRAADRIIELQTAAAEEGADIDALSAQIDELNRPMFEYLEPLIREMVDRTCDTPLPDLDDWPPWLALNANLPFEVLGHWRTVPKAPGAAGTN